MVAIWSQVGAAREEETLAFYYENYTRKEKKKKKNPVDLRAFSARGFKNGSPRCSTYAQVTETRWIISSAELILIEIGLQGKSPLERLRNAEDFPAFHPSSPPPPSRPRGECKWSLSLEWLNKRPANFALD